MSSHAAIIENSLRLQRVLSIIINRPGVSAGDIEDVFRATYRNRITAVGSAVCEINNKEKNGKYLGQRGILKIDCRKNRYYPIYLKQTWANNNPSSPPLNLRGGEGSGESSAQKLIKEANHNKSATDSPAPSGKPFNDWSGFKKEKEEQGGLF